MTKADYAALLEEGFSSTYEAAANALKYEVLQLAATGASHFPLIEHMFARPMRRISDFRVQPLESAAFKFEPERGRFIINDQPLLALLTRVLDDVKASDEEGRLILDRDEVYPLLRRVFRLYLLHEVGHIPQGLAEHSSVGALKKIAGAEFMADMDLFADRNAAAAYAALEVAGQQNAGRANYLEHFQAALYFMGQYSFPVFRFTANRMPKMARAIGLTLMATRLARIDLSRPDLNQVEKVSPLDGCIMVKIAGDYSSLVVLLTEPDTQIVNITCEVPDDRLKQLAMRIEEGDFLGAIDAASVLLASLRIVF